MYSKVTYASAWKAMNGFSESMLDELPSRNTPPFLIAPPPAELLPHPAAATTTATATAASPDTRRTQRVVPGSCFGWDLTMHHPLWSGTTAAPDMLSRRLAAVARQVASGKVISAYSGQFAGLPIIVDLTGGG